MSGGDLESALHKYDVPADGEGAGRRLGWYARGRNVLLCVARGLAHLHSQRVRKQSSESRPGHAHIKFAQFCA